MEKIKEILLGKTAKRFYWTVAGAVVAVTGTMLAGIRVPSKIVTVNDLLKVLFVGVSIALVTGLSKEINNRISGK